MDNYFYKAIFFLLLCSFGAAAVAHVVEIFLGWEIYDNLLGGILGLVLLDRFRLAARLEEV